MKFIKLIVSLQVVLWNSTLLCMAQSLSPQEPTNKNAYNVEVRFRRAFGTIGSDGSGGNQPDPAWQIKTANDTDNIANSLLDNSRTVAGIDNNAYCYWLTTIGNVWHPVQNDLLGVYTNNFTGRVDYEVMSYENDYLDQCIYHADPPGQDNINDDDNMAFQEGQLSYTNNDPGVYHNETRFLTNNSRVEFSYIWRLANGTRSSPLSFGAVNNCNEYVHDYTIKDKVATYQSTETYFQNDWTSSDHPSFDFGTQMTYVFYTDRDRRLFLQNNSSEITAHLLKIDSSYNLLSYISQTSNSLDTTLGKGLYAVVMENGEPSDTFELSLKFEDAIHNPPVYASNTVFVKADANADGDGSSWSNATPYLQAAINAAQEGQQIWMSQGSYSTNSCGSRELFFYLEKNVEIYGGFEGNEGSLSERIQGQNTTYLTGEIGSIATSDNTRTIMKIDGVDRSALLNNLTFTAAEKSAIRISGAAPTIDECNFTKNRNESAIFITASADTSSYPKITNTLFNENSSFELGGAIYVQSGISSINRAEVINCIFKDNSASYGGGAVALSGSIFEPRVTMTNCTFHDNSSGLGGAVFTIDSNVTGSGPILTIQNSIFWNDDITVSQIIHGYSNTYINLVNSLIPFDNSTQLQGTSAGTITDVNSVYNLDPQFLNMLNGDLRIDFSSPAVDKGNSVFNDLSRDFAKRQRIQGSHIDLGAFENQPKAFVNKSTPVSGTGESWASPAKELYKVLGESRVIWVAAGTYYPTATQDEKQSFVIADSTVLYGGFEGNEPNGFDLNLRNFDANETVLSGDIGVTNDSTDNSLHVVIIEDASGQTILDGFTIKEGNSRMIFSEGGGLLNRVTSNGDSSSPSLSNLKFVHNRAISGGAYANSGNGVFNTRFVNCTFEDNYASSIGGAVYLLPSLTSTGNQTFSNVSFKSNHASEGGAIYARQNGHLTIDSCFFDHNRASSEGGAIYMESGTLLSQVSYIESTFTNNISNATGGGFYLSGIDGVIEASIENCNFSNNSNTENAADLFIDALRGTVELQARKSVFSNNDVNAGDLIRSILSLSTYKAGFENCLFYGQRDQAIVLNGTPNVDSVRFNHCTFSGFELGVFNNTSAFPIAIENSILWNNGSIANSLSKVAISNSVVDTLAISGVNGNIMTDPKFVAPEAGVFYLNCGSSAIGLADAGTGLSVDISGFNRGISKDAGAYEFRYENIIESIDGNDIFADLVNTSVSLDGMVVAPEYRLIQAENSITLNPGFLMQSGLGRSSVFKASIGEGCP